jgi:hypothetical protein
MPQSPVSPGATFRHESFIAICNKVDKDMNKPEIVYEFSNGKKFESSDRGEDGVYRR